MKEETKKRRERMKAKILEVERKAKKSGKDLTTVEKNKIMLDLITKKMDDVEEIVETVEEKEKIHHPIKHRHFKCSCGIPVELIGEVDGEREKCSKCLELEIA